MEEAFKLRTEEKHPAEDLYKGEHWSVVRGILAAAGKQGWDVCLWVCSAAMA